MSHWFGICVSGIQDTKTTGGEGVPLHDVILA